jgi:hypothetical protein
MSLRKPMWLQLLINRHCSTCERSRELQYTYNVYVNNTHTASTADITWKPGASGATWTQT